MPFRKTKIVCTIGPAVAEVEKLKQLLKAGMNVARFNFSHGDHAYHKSIMEMVRQASKETNIPVALLLDTKGPEIRTGRIKNDGKITLVHGKTIVLTTDDVEGTDTLLSISYKKLPEEISAEKHLLVADGLVNLKVEKIVRNEIHCFIENGGTIGSRKNVNVLGVKTSLPAVTEQDLKDIMFGIEHRIDFIAASFVRKPADIMEIRGIIDVSDVKIEIIAKIEDEEGLENVDEIIRVADGIMVARGDLGVQLPAHAIPLVQKRIIAKCNAANKVVITATQMLESMITNPLPTRAEVTDVANAILDGTDAIMLSGETASGLHPVRAVKVMHNIALEIERSPEYKHLYPKTLLPDVHLNMADTISYAAAITARDITADAILAPTLHGTTPKLLSRYRPNQLIIAVTPFEDVRRRLLLYWGVHPIISEAVGDADTMIDQAVAKGLKHKLLRPFDKIVIAAGIPVNSPIMLNTIRVHIIAKVVCKGLRGYGKITGGRIVKVKNSAEAIQRITGDGTEILLAKYFDESILPVIKKIPGYILQEFSSISWQEIEKENQELVAIAGATNAMELLTDGDWVTLDGVEKLVLEGCTDEMKAEDKK
ncbi:MAG: pyruvate kinase [Spirochaetales bacterium]|nr:pyruvate kinase [Spirochaetales bacterium]